MGSTVSVGQFEISSNHESADDMVAALTQPKDKGQEPRVVQRDGKPVEQKDDDAETVSKAASELGKRGGKAAAEARQRAADDAAKPVQSEAKDAEKAGDDGAKDAGKADEKQADDAEKPHKGDPRRDPEARVRVVTSQLAEARQRNQMLEERLAKLEQAIQQPKERREEPQQRQQAQPAGDSEDPEPQEEQFSAYRDYVKAQARWEARQEYRAARRVEAEQQQERARREETVRSFNALEGQFQKAYEADPGVTDRLDPRLLATMREAMSDPAGDWTSGPGKLLTNLLMNSEHGFAMMLHLSEHEDEVTALLRAPNAAMMARSFGMLEARLAQPAQEPPVQEQPVRRPSQAPPPLRPVTATTTGEVDIYGDIPFDQFMSRRKAKR